LDYRWISQFLLEAVQYFQLIEGEEAEAAQAKVKKFYRKGMTRPKKQEKNQTPAPSAQDEVAFSAKTRDSHILMAGDST